MYPEVCCVYFSAPPLCLLMKSDECQDNFVSLLSSLKGSPVVGACCCLGVNSIRVRTPDSSPSHHMNLNEVVNTITAKNNNYNKLV